MPVFLDPNAESLGLSLVQFAPVLGDVAANVTRLQDLLADADADLAVTPELSLTGYDLRDGAADVTGSATMKLATSTPTLVGAVASANAGLLYNAAVLANNESTKIVHRKVYLPTYGMFDEGRYFARGDRVAPFDINGWRIGVLICEDFWHPALTYLLAMQGIHGLIVMAAAPGRGSIQGGEEGAFFASSDSWERIARTMAQMYGIYVAVCNRTGVEGGVTFAGESIIVAPDAAVIARAGVEAEVLRVKLQRDAVMRARRPYAHLRDDQTELVLAELQRIGSHAHP